MLDVVAEELRERRASLSVLTKTKEAKEKEAKEKEDLGPDRIQAPHLPSIHTSHMGHTCIV